MKKCKGPCGLLKDLSEFHKDKGLKDGHRNVCKACTSIRSKEQHKKNKDRKKQYDKAYRLANSEYIKRRNAASRKTKKGKFLSLKSCAKHRNIEVQISFEEYDEILQTNKCFYCDESLENVGGGSLNRIDSNKGYTIENVKPCCDMCNRIMSDFTKEELKSRLIKIHSRLDHK